MKYRSFYGSLAPRLQDDNNTATAELSHIEMKETIDALLCVELLIEVMSLQPSALLQDILHLLLKSNLVKSRIEWIDSISSILNEQMNQYKDHVTTPDNPFNQYTRKVFRI